MPTTDPGRILRTRGTITVVAVFMAAAMVGALWFVIGIGDALLYRQQMQDAADAAAYTGAVYHARGMNLLAVLNLVMAALVAVMVALRLVELLNLAAMVLSCAISSLCSVGVGCWAAPICSFTNQFRPQIANAVRRYEEGVIDRVLPALSRAQHRVAISMPEVARQQAARAAEHRGGAIQRGVLLSPSGLMRSQPPPLGLPVEAGAWEVLCERAGEHVAEVAFDPFPFGQWLAGVTGSMLSSFPAYFCGDYRRPNVADEQSAIDEQCDLRREAHEQQSDSEFDTEQCLEEVRHELADAFGEAAQRAGPGTGDLASAAPIQMARAARNGGEWMQLWGVAIGDPSSLGAAEAGVRVALWSRTASPRGPQHGRMGLAQAEFYYDTDRPWDEVREEAVWNMRWRARLRRLRPIDERAARELAVDLDAASTELQDALSGAVELIH